MPRWTNKRKIACGSEWYGDQFDYEGPACYELGTGGPKGGNIQWRYVGETSNEKKRIEGYARNGSHLSEIINDHLREAGASTTEL